MTAAVDHPFSTIVHNAARGNFPEPDRRAEVVGALPGPCDAVAFLPGHTVVAADVDEDWVFEQLSYQKDRAASDPSTGLGLFLAAMTTHLGNPPTFASVLTVAPHRAAMLRGELEEQPGTANPGWSPYRTDVRSYGYRSSGATGRLDMGRGPGGRLDVYIQVDEGARGGGGPSRELLTAAMTMVPSNTDLFGSAPVHDTRALRTMLGGGFTPVCTEVLFLTRPQG